MEEIDEIIAQLRKFSSEVAELGGSVNATLVSDFEQIIDKQLPEDYKYLLGKVNGFNIMGSEVYGLKGITNTSSLEANYAYEHFEVKFPQPEYLVNFSSDGGGNFYCFDTRFRTNGEKSCPVVFWYSNYVYTEEDVPEVVYNSFVDFVNEVIINWVLEDYDYDGNAIT